MSLDDWKPPKQWKSRETRYFQPKLGEYKHPLLRNFFLGFSYVLMAAFFIGMIAVAVGESSGSSGVTAGNSSGTPPYSSSRSDLRNSSNWDDAIAFCTTDDFRFENGLTVEECAAILVPLVDS